MRGTTTILMCALVVGLCSGPAAAASGGQFSVGVQVVSSRPADRGLLGSVPVPGDAVRIGSQPGVDHHAYPGSLAQAAAFYRQSLDADGWRLVQWRGDGEHQLEQVWEGRDGRLLLRLQAALGEVPATRISLSASAARSL